MAAGKEFKYRSHPYSVQGSPLYFFYDCEATGNVVHEDKIIEIAAVLYTKNLDTQLSRGQIQELSRVDGEHFQSLCHCTKPLHPIAAQMTGLTLADLRHEPPLPTVLQKLFDWITAKVELAESFSRGKYTPVLVAHSGSTFDFPLIYAELERGRYSDLERKIERMTLHFADTFAACKMLSTRSDAIFTGVKGLKLSVEFLYKHFFPNEPYNAHRALEDATTVCKLFTDSPLSGKLETLRDTIQNIDIVRKKWKSVELRQAGINSWRKAEEIVFERHVTLSDMEWEYKRNPRGFDNYLKRNLGIKFPREEIIDYFSHLQ